MTTYDIITTLAITSALLVAALAVVAIVRLRQKKNINWLIAGAGALLVLAIALLIVRSRITPFA